MKQSNLSSFFKRKSDNDGDKGDRASRASTSTVGSDSNTKTTSNKHFKPLEHIHPEDIGNFLHGAVAVADKIKIINSLWSPLSSYMFPLLDKFKDKKNKLRFQHKWLTEFNWLCYSAKENGAFCKYCVFFATTGGKGGQLLGSLVKVKMDNWKKAKEVSISNV